VNASRRVIEAGDAALLLRLGDNQAAWTGVDAVAINREAIAIAEEIRRSRVRGVRDVLSTYRSVAIYFDPLVADLEGLEAVLLTVRGAQLAEVRDPIMIPVAYGGEDGPDLEALAAFAACDVETVVRRHAAVTYRVFMLGFLPGFPYMAAVDDSLAMPRRDSPRLRVAAGSVGIAGHQTGIYPSDSPGGWQIIGRTFERLFDPYRNPAALLRPGDRVRFVPMGEREARKSEVRSQKSESTKSEESGVGITVLKPGLLTTVQDGGRWGYHSLGVPPAGPMDPLAHRTANHLVGNPPGAAALEVTLLGPQLRVERDVEVGLAGADLSATVNGVRLEPGATADCVPGSVIDFGARKQGGRAYLAFGGGIEVPSVLGSRAVHLPSQMGGVAGRPLQAGDVLPLAAHVRAAGARTVLPREIPAGGVRLRVTRGPQADRFDEPARAALERNRFVISPESNRMGFRLTGAKIPVRADVGEMVSDAAFTGALQVPPSGEPILLMADRQTTGGYPQIAVVISADLPAAGQLLPGDWVEFEWCTRDAAVRALRQQTGHAAV
jgi:KipI family sensor histidine kinase inhibitor